MELIKKLQQIDLCKREAEVYIALLQKREFTAPELAKITTVTRTKIYEILQNLVRKGMCSEINKNGQKLYHAIKPSIILPNIISNIELEIEQHKKTAAERKKKAAIEREKKEINEQKKVAAAEQKKMVAMSLVQELTSLYEDKQHNLDPLDYIEVLTDVGQIRERWLRIQANTKKEMLAFTKPPYATPSMLNDTDLQAEMINQNKIVIKNIYEYQNLNSDEIINLIEVIEAYQNAGEQARIIKELPMKLVICDDSITMLALNDRVSLKQSITTIIIDHPSFAKAQREVFYAYWEKAISVEEFKKRKFDNINSSN